MGRFGHRLLRLAAIQAQAQQPTPLPARSLSQFRQALPKLKPPWWVVVVVDQEKLLVDLMLLEVLEELLVFHLEPRPYLPFLLLEDQALQLLEHPQVVELALEEISTGLEEQAQVLLEVLFLVCQK